MRYLAIDVKTLGRDPETCDLIEIAAVIEDSESPHSYEEAPKFHAYVLPPAGREHQDYTGDAYYREHYRHVLDHIRGCSDGMLLPCRLKFKLASFLDVYGMTETDGSLSFRHILLAVRDYALLAHLKHWGLRFRDEVICPSMLLRDPVLDSRMPTFDQLQERAGLTWQSYNSVHDAWKVIEMVRLSNADLERFYRPRSGTGPVEPQRPRTPDVTGVIKAKLEELHRELSRRGLSKEQADAAIHEQIEKMTALSGAA